MIAHIRSTRVKKIEELDVSEKGQKDKTASKYLKKLTDIIQVYHKGLSTDIVLKIINKLNVFEAQCLFASAAHKHLKQSLTGDMCFTVPMLNLPEKLEIKDLGQLQSIELIPYIAKQLGIESAKILVSDQHTGKPYYFKLNNNKCELHINENPIQPLFEIIHNGEHFDIKVPEDLHGPFVDNNDYDKMEGFTAFIEEYTKGRQKYWCHY